MVKVIGGCIPARGAGMLVVGQPLSCYHLETDGSDNVDLPNCDVLVHHETTSRLAKAHGCLPTDADLAFALGTLKHGGLDPALGAAHVTIDPVVKLRHDVFDAFNKCLVHYLTVSIGPSIDGSGNGLGAVHTDDSSGSGCQLCIIISRLALHSSACEDHYLVCSDFCLPLYNLIDYHLAACCRRSLCHTSLCDELRTVLLQSQPMEQRSHALDRAWYRLRSRLASVLLPLQRAATSAEVQQLARRMVGLRSNGGMALGARGGGGGAGVGIGSEPSSSAVDAPTGADATTVRSSPGGSSMQAVGPAAQLSPGIIDGRRHSSNSPSGSGVVGDCSEESTGSSSCSSSSHHASANSADWDLPQCSRPTDLTQLIFSGSIPTGDQLEERLANAVGEFGHVAVGGVAPLAAARIGQGGRARMPSAGSYGSNAPNSVAFAYVDPGGLRESVNDSPLLPRLSVLCPSEQSAADDNGEHGDSGPQEQWPDNTATEHPVVAAQTLGLLDASRPIIGQGRVAYGEPRHLLELVQYWRNLQERLHKGQPCNDNVRDNCDTDIWEGIILTGKDSQLRVQDGNYQKRVHWTKQTFLGRGVSGQVHLAIDNESEFSFVTKKVELHDFTHEELCVWAELEHPSIVQLYGALRHGQKLYYLCEFYAGGTLSALVQRSHALDQWKTLFYMDQILNALAYLHEKRIIHEDLKADNIYLKLESHVLGIGDFGLSCKLRPGQSTVVPGTHPVGGQTQWSPEKARSDGHGFAADIWAAMCTMVHMLSGHHPWEQRFKGCHALHYIIALNSPPTDDIPRGLLDEVMDLITCGWVIDPHKRPTANKLLQHRCFDHLQKGFPGDPKYTSHFAHLQLVPDDVFDSYAADRDEELDEDGENYIAEIVERVRRESAGQYVVSEGEGVNAFGAGPVHALWTEHDIRTCATAVAASDAVITLSGGGLGDPKSAAGIARQPQQDAGSEAESSSSPIRFDWCSTAASPAATVAPLGGKDWYHDKGATLPARLGRGFFNEAIEEEQPLSSLSDDVRMQSPSSLLSPPVLSATADALSSSSSSSTAAATASGSGKQKRRNPGLHVNVHVTSPTRTTSSPASPAGQQLRHSFSLDSGQQAVTTPGSAGSGGGEGKPRTLRHSVTSPSVLMTRSNAFDDGVGEQQQQVLRPQHCTPQSAGSSSLALRSSDLNAPGLLATPGALLPDLTHKRRSTASSSAYGSGTPFDGPASLPAAATRSPATRDSSQGYGTGYSAATPESACSVFAGCSETPPTSKAGATQRLSRSSLASLSQQKQHAHPATPPCLHGAARPQHDVAIAQRPPASHSPATDNADDGGALTGPKQSSGLAACVDGQLAAPLPPTRQDSNTASATAAPPPDAPGVVPAAADQLSLLNPLDTSFIITSSDYEMEPAPTNDSADGVTRAGARGADLVPDGFDLRLPDEQEQRPQLEKDESSSDDEEYLSILKQSLKQSGSLNNPYAVFVAGDRCYKLPKDQEIGKLKLCHDMTWLDAVLLMSATVHSKGFESFTVLHEDGKEIYLYDKIPFQPTVLTVRDAADGGPWQWWITNRTIKYNDENVHHGPFLDCRS